MRHVQSLLNAEPPPARSETVIVTCPEGEIHAYPSVVLTYLLRRAGWPVLFLDANLPARDLANTVTQEKPAFVLLCVQTVPALRALLAGAEVLSRLGMRFGFGGSVFLRYPSLIARVPGIYLGDRLTDTPDILQRAVNGTVQPNIVAPVDTAWRDMALALPEALIKVEADVVRQSEMLGLAREAVAAELELLRGYLLSIVTLGAAELLPGLWDWSDRMQKARGFDPAARAALLDTYRKSLRFHLSQPGPLAPAL